MAELNEKEREELVAYLDGELDEKRARAVEAKISIDGRFRAEADALKQAWALLDYLPRAEPSSGFTHRTLERLAVGRPRPTGVMPRPRRRRWALGLAWAAAVLAAAAAGFWAARGLSPHQGPAAVPDRTAEGQLVEHLRVVQNYRQYELVDDYDTLAALDAPDLFGDDGDS